MGRLDSTTDLGINKSGKEEVRQVAAALGRCDVQHILVSPSLRARETVQEILETDPGWTLRARVTVDERLRELCFGPFEGLTREEMRERKLDQAFEDWITQKSPEVPAGAESYSTAEARARSVFDFVIAIESETVLLVSHGHFSRILLSTCVLGANASYHRRLRFDSAHFADVRIEAGMPRLIGFNTRSLPVK